ncbi:MAG: hypothetical protein IJD23_03565 [Spirochaetaceae bacterium]|nr:hypothetical protein [Spirochaetaceae bacterium]
MIGSGHKTDKVFAHYANHIKKESALETIAKTSERSHRVFKMCFVNIFYS